MGSSNISTSFPFGMPNTSQEEPRRETIAPQTTSSSSLDIPEFLNPKNRL